MVEYSGGSYTEYFQNKLIFVDKESARNCYDSKFELRHEMKLDHIALCYADIKPNNQIDKMDAAVIVEWDCSDEYELDSINPDYDPELEEYDFDAEEYYD